MEWARQQLDLANQRITQGMGLYDEALWDLWRADFIHTWRDTSILEDAQMKLDKLAIVTGSRDRLACMPVDRGKSWEPAHTS